MNALGQAQVDSAVRESAGPGSSRVHHGPCGNIHWGSCQSVLELAFPDFAGNAILKPAIIQQGGPVFCRRTQCVEHEAGLIGESVEIADRAFYIIPAQAVNFLNRFVFVQPGGIPKVLSTTQQIINFHSDLELPQPPIPIATIDRKNKWQRLRQMRSNTMNDFLFHARLPHKAETSLSQIAHPAVKQAAGAATGAEGEIMLLRSEERR